MPSTKSKPSPLLEPRSLMIRYTKSGLPPMSMLSYYGRSKSAPDVNGRSERNTYRAREDLGVGCEFESGLGKYSVNSRSYTSQADITLTSPIWKNRLSRFANWAGVSLKRPTTSSNTAPVASTYALKASESKVSIQGITRSRLGQTSGEQKESCPSVGDSGTRIEYWNVRCAVSHRLIDPNERCRRKSGRDGPFLHFSNGQCHV